MNQLTPFFQYSFPLHIEITGQSKRIHRDYRFGVIKVLQRSQRYLASLGSSWRLCLLCPKNMQIRNILGSIAEERAGI
jgi:hypothetical protein